MDFEIIVLGINHKTAPVEVREKLAFTEKELERALYFSQDIDRLLEAVIISTCNRTEVYGVVEGLSDCKRPVVDFLTQFKDIEEEKLNNCFYLYRGFEAFVHLFEVATGLDSMVLGETEILGQVKESYQKSMETNRADTVFHALFRQALTVGKRVHRETEINDHAASVSYVAVILANKIFQTIAHQKIMVIGAGEMAQLTLKHLCDKGVKDLIIVNRSLDQANKLAELFNGRVVGHNYLFDMLLEADIVISSTSAPHFVVDRERMEKVMISRNHKKIFLIDIAVPRDIDPRVKDIDGVHLYNIDDLQAVLESNMKERELAAKKAKKIIHQEARDFQDWLNARRVVPLIKALRERAEDIRLDHLERTMDKLKGLSEKEKKVVENLSKNIINDFLREPVLRLKELAAKESSEESIDNLCHLFSLDTDVEREKILKSKKSDRG